MTLFLRLRKNKVYTACSDEGHGAFTAWLICAGMYPLAHYTASALSSNAFFLGVNNLGSVSLLKHIHGNML